MKILVVTQYFYPEHFKINDLVIALSEAGHEVTVFTGKPNYPQGKIYSGYRFWGNQVESYHRAKVYRCPLIPRGKSKIQLVLNYFSFIFFGVLGIFQLRKNKYDHIFIYEVSPITVALPAIFLNYFTSTKISMWLTDLWPESLSATGVVKNKTALKLVSLMVKFIYQKLDLILMSSEAYQTSILKHGGKLEQIRYYPHWAEDFYRPMVVPDSEKKLNREQFNIVFAGNIGVAQDFPTILQAAQLLKSHPRIHWVIAGDGRERAKIQAEVRKLNLEQHFTFLGRRPASDMPALFAEADALLMTLRDEPIFAYTIPTKLQTYMACARPVVASMNGEGAKIIADAQCGFHGPAGDSKALAGNILKLFSLSKQENATLGQNALNYYAKNFARDSLIHQLIEWMK